MEVLIAGDLAEVGRIAADRILRSLRDSPSPVLGVATGSSPISVYAELERRVERGQLVLDDVRGFALDEYVGLPPDDERSYASFVRNRIERPLGMEPGSIRVPDGMAADLDSAADAFDAAIVEAGGIDVQLVGVGTNGHIGFNEPSSSLASRTRVTTLASTTRHDNSRFFDDPQDVPRLCITQGLGTISDARHVVLVAAGATKARAVKAVVEGPVTSMWPGSVLQLHQHATVVIDEEAARDLVLRDYYRSARPAATRFVQG